MRVLMMISNSNMAVREVYTLVLRERFPGWGLSNMSGMPPGAAGIINSFDVVIYELGAPDDPRRYQAILSLVDLLGAEVSRPIVTHIEGTFREGVVAELEGRGVIVVGVPFSPDTIAEALKRAVPTATTPKAGEQAPPDSGFGGRLRGLFRRRA